MENKAAPGVPFYTPEQSPPSGTALNPATAPTLFQPLKIRDLTLQNRFAVSPMCQYSADDGHLTDWHFAHLSQFAIRGAALTIVEATAVLANGRITPVRLLTRPFLYIYTYIYSPYKSGINV